jgi:hypothetical protein
MLKKQLIPTGIEYEFLYKHFNEKLGYAKININSKTCTCHKYFDKGICKHLVAACLQVKISLPGLEQLPKKFKILRRKKRNQYIDISGEEIDLAVEQERPLVEIPIDEPPRHETEVGQVEACQAENQVPIPKKRGRKPKIVTPIDNSNPLGRPPLARNALENDTVISVVLRRSNRNKT